MLNDWCCTTFESWASAFTVGRKKPIEIFIDTRYLLDPVATTLAVPGRCGSIAAGSVRASQTVAVEAVIDLLYSNFKRSAFLSE
jgi:hypothetical protein